MRFDRQTTAWLVLAALVPAAAFGQTVQKWESERLEGPKQERKERPNGPDLSRVADLIVEKTNRFRRNKGLQPVETNAALAETARDFADYMARTDK